MTTTTPTPAGQATTNPYATPRAYALTALASAAVVLAPHLAGWIVNR